MAAREMKNNQAEIKGTVVSDFVYSHEVHGEGFYMMKVEVERISGYTDIIPVMVSDRLLDVNQDYSGYLIDVKGQFRSFNRHGEGKSRLELYMFAREIEFIEALEVSASSNRIHLEGFICKKSVYRETPRGREITDLIIAVNRPYGKADYIPGICWGRNAKCAANLPVGTYCTFEGRIQSREYIKKFEDGQTEKRLAYEVSISKLEVIRDEE